jgi:DNA polymerase
MSCHQCGKTLQVHPAGENSASPETNSVEIKACRPWFEKEREIVRPKLIVAMGATAVQCVFGKALPIARNRGRVVALDEQTSALVTIHPSYILRLDDGDKEREYSRFVEDLRLAAPFARRRRAA